MNIFANIRTIDNAGIWCFSSLGADICLTMAIQTNLSRSAAIATFTAILIAHQNIDFASVRQLAVAIHIISHAGELVGIGDAALDIEHWQIQALAAAICRSALAGFGAHATTANRVFGAYIVARTAVLGIRKQIDLTAIPHLAVTIGPSLHTNRRLGILAALNIGRCAEFTAVADFSIAIDPSGFADQICAHATGYMPGFEIYAAPLAHLVTKHASAGTEVIRSIIAAP